MLAGRGALHNYGKRLGWRKDLPHCLPLTEDLEHYLAERLAAVTEAVNP